ncbi:MAG: NUDIX domain-containing protein [Gemmataceae bacterium]
MKQSAGLLLHRTTDRGLEVLLIHASGAYNRKAPWGIPKGEIDPGETPEQAARRETNEETGVAVTGPLADLGHVVYTKSRKRIFCFAGPAPGGCVPVCASWEIDHAEFLTLDVARERIHPDQAAFLDRLLTHLGGGTPPGSASGAPPAGP